MCGIAGMFASSGFRSEQLTEIGNMMGQQLHYRGPDDCGVWHDAASGIMLAHRRLSIVDLSPAGHQPMESVCGRYVLVFNGEVYNHLVLRAELQAIGSAPVWRGHSDTETLLAGLSVWGLTATLERAVGMFAIALWDRAEHRLTLARDRMGEKPLFYGWVRGSFVFGSELKALRALPGFDNPVSRTALGMYLERRFVPAPYSIYEDVFKLEPGRVLSIDTAGLADRSLQISQYWRFTDAVRQGLATPLQNEFDAVAALDAALREAVALQKVADVPLGAFLSGGVDSSMVVALMQAQSMQPVKTFTVGFDVAEFDESLHAQAVARHLGTEHHALRVTADDVLAVIPLLPAIYDEPFADSSQIPTHLVCKAARQHVAVALSGDAGDELFGGYNHYFSGQGVWKHLGWIPPAVRRQLGSSIQKVPVTVWDALGSVLPGARDVVRFGDKAHKLAYRLKTVQSLDDLHGVLMTDWPQVADTVRGSANLTGMLDVASVVAGVAEPEHRMMLRDTLSYLPDDILTKVDRAGMSVSLETRIPFLDHRVVELAWSLPLHMKMRNGQGKWALREVLYKYVPRSLIERPKAGFSFPLAQWLRGPLRDWAEGLLDETRLRQDGYFNPAPIRALWNQHLSARHDWSVRLWSVLMFQAWLDATC